MPLELSNLDLSNINISDLPENIQAMLPEGTSISELMTYIKSFSSDDLAALGLNSETLKHYTDMLNLNGGLSPEDFAGYQEQLMGALSSMGCTEGSSCEAFVNTAQGIVEMSGAYTAANLMGSFINQAGYKLSDALEWSMQNNVLQYALSSYICFQLSRSSYQHYRRGEYIDAALDLTGVLVNGFGTYLGYNFAEIGGFGCAFELTRAGVKWMQGKTAAPHIMNAGKLFTASMIPATAFKLAGSAVESQQNMVILSIIGTVLGLKGQGITASAIKRKTIDLAYQKVQSLVAPWKDEPPTDEQVKELIILLGSISDRSFKGKVLLMPEIRMHLPKFDAIFREFANQASFKPTTDLYNLILRLDFFANLIGKASPADELHHEMDHLYKALVAARVNEAASRASSRSSTPEEQALKDVGELMWILTLVNNLPEDVLKVLIDADLKQEDRLVQKDRKRLLQRLPGVAWDCKENVYPHTIPGYTTAQEKETLAWNNVNTLLSNYCADATVRKQKKNEAKPALLLSGGPANGGGSMGFIQSQSNSFLDDLMQNPVSAIRNLVNPLGSSHRRRNRM